MIRDVGIVMPVLDDWESLAVLLRELDIHLAGSVGSVHVFIVDDGSRAPFDPTLLDLPATGVIAGMRVIRLAGNLGHQRAIAVGLIEAAQRDDLDAVIVMDSDGEDRPEDIPRMLTTAESSPDVVVMAQRAKRSEALGFRLAYAAYKLLFRVATGKAINFGNFSLLPMAAARRLIYMPELWNNLPASVMRSRIPFLAIPTARGHRYAGQSRLNAVGLITHGLSAMSVYADVIFVRILAAAAVLAGCSIVGMAVVTAIRLFTTMAAPGWATNVVGNLLVLLLQTVVIVVVSTLMQLAGRSNRQIVPAVDAAAFVAERRDMPLRVAEAAADTERPMSQ